MCRQQLPFAGVLGVVRARREAFQPSAGVPYVRKIEAQDAAEAAIPREASARKRVARGR